MHLRLVCAHHVAGMDHTRPVRQLEHAVSLWSPSPTGGPLYRVNVLTDDGCKAACIVVLGKVYAVAYDDMDRAERVASALSRGEWVDVTDHMVPIKLEFCSGSEYT